jgi:hypothetical protein
MTKLRKKYSFELQNAEWIKHNFFANQIYADSCCVFFLKKNKFRFDLYVFDI